MTNPTTGAKFLLGLPPPVHKHSGDQCAVDSCGRACRAMSKYCLRHAAVYYRTRHPEGRLPRARELRPYREQALYAMQAYGLAEHPAIIAAQTTLEQMIARSENIPKPYAAHFRRLHEGGAKGDEMFLRILEVYGARYVALRDTWADDCVFYSCLGSRWLRTVSVGWYTTAGGRREQVRIPGLIMETVGRALAERVGVVAMLFWQRAEREHNQRAVEALSIREVLEQTPL